MWPKSWSVPPLQRTVGPRPAQGVIITVSTVTVGATSEAIRTDWQIIDGGGVVRMHSAASLRRPRGTLFLYAAESLIARPATC